MVQRCFRGLPWWSSDEESSFWCKGHGFDPWSGKIPPAAEQLSPSATVMTAAPTCCKLPKPALEPALCSGGNLSSEGSATATGESQSAATKSQHSPK